MKTESSVQGNAVNMSTLDRSASVFAGLALTALGLKTKGGVRYVATAMGGEMLRRGLTGHCYVYGRMGQSRESDPTRDRLRGPRGILVEESIIINKNVGDVFRFWRNFENLPKFMRHLVEVENLDKTRSHWIALGPAGKTVEWDAEIINERPNELIGWRSVGSQNDVYHAGSVRFRESPGNRTEIRVRMQYQPRGGKLAGMVASLFGEEPSQQIRDDLSRLKRSLESIEGVVSELTGTHRR